MKPTSNTSPDSLLYRCSTPPPPGTLTPSDNAISPPSFGRELPSHKSWSMEDSWERTSVDWYTGYLSKTSSLQALKTPVLQRAPGISNQFSPVHCFPNPFPCHADISQSNAQSRTALQSPQMRPTSPTTRPSDPLKRSSTPPPPGTASPAPLGSKTASLSTLASVSYQAASCGRATPASADISLEAPLKLPTQTTGHNSPKKVRNKVCRKKNLTASLQMERMWCLFTPPETHGWRSRPRWGKVMRMRQGYLVQPT